MIVRASRGLALGSLMVVALGCPPKKEAVVDSGAAPEAAASAPVEAGPVLEAVNQNEVKTYPDQSKVDHVPMTTEWSVSNVRTATGGGGDLVATLKKGTDVQKIGEKDNYYLVVFNDPSDPSKKLMGWINHIVFSPEPKHDAGRIHPVCQPKQVIILLEGGNEECVWPCTNDDQCGAGKICDGDGVLSVKWEPGPPVQFCRIGNRSQPPPPPPPPVVDAGPPPVVDAGPPPVADAGAPIDGGAKVMLDVKRSDAGTCPAGYALCGAMCRMTCNVDSDCKLQTAKCTNKFCLGPGTLPCK